MIRRIYYAHCDGPDCRAILSARSHRELKRVKTDQGWKAKTKRDLCPLHQPKAVAA